MGKNRNLGNIQPTLGYDDKTGQKLPTPDDLPEPERPPLRHIDHYVKAECPCLSQRYTIALLTCIGFIISFGMRCNMGMAKLQFEHFVSFSLGNKCLGLIFQLLTPEGEKS